MESLRATALAAEKTALLRMLDDIPEENVIDRGSFEARLRGVEAQLAAESGGRRPLNAQLTFRGRPVVGNQGVFARFGAAAIDQFSRAVALLAASLAEPLGSRGRIPGGRQNELLVVGVALGSFGFTLEEHRPDALRPDLSSPVKRALEQAQGLLEGSLASDDELAEAASGLDPRARSAIRDFLKLIEGFRAPG